MDLIKYRKQSHMLDELPDPLHGAFEPEYDYFRYCYKKGGGGQPAAPDPVATANAQAAANKEAVLESAKVNQINEVTPYGTLTYTGDIGSPDRTRTTELTPEGQALFDKQQSIAGTLGDYAQTRAQDLPTGPFTLEQFGDLPTFDNTYRQQVQDDMLARLQPQLDRRRDQLATNLANQGITMGSEAWNQAQDDLSREVNDLRLGISGMAGDEMSRLFNLQLNGRQQGINEYQLERSAPINEVAAALQGSPAINSPNFSPNSQYQIGAPDISGLTMASYNAQANAAANAANNRSALTGNLIGAAGALGGAAILSDRRLKKNIRKVGKVNGLSWYSYQYIWGGPRRVGVMAQEVLKQIPEAVAKIGPFLAVDYSKLEAAR